MKWSIDEFCGLERRWCLVIDNRPTSQPINYYFNLAAKRFNSTVTGIYKISDPAALTELVASRNIIHQNPQIVFANFMTNQMQNRFLSLIREYNLENRFQVVFILGNPLTGEDSKNGDYENIYVGMPWYWKLMKENEAAKRFVDHFKKKTDKPPNWLYAIAYETTRLILDRAAKIQSIDINKLVDSLEGYEFNYLRGKDKIRKEDHISESSYVILKGIKDKTPDEMFEIITVLQAICDPRHC